tara:strand:+ start:177 stop:377 length:201 start_codon:yes stop_codon:yes gene_type:complete
MNNEEKLVLYCVKDIYYHALEAIASGHVRDFNSVTIDVPWCQDMGEVQDVADKLRDILESMGETAL